MVAKKRTIVSKIDSSDEEDVAKDQKGACSQDSDNEGTSGDEDYDSEEYDSLGDDEFVIDDDGNPVSMNDLDSQSEHSYSSEDSNKEIRVLRRLEKSAMKHKKEKSKQTKPKASKKPAKRAVKKAKKSDTNVNKKPIATGKESIKAFKSNGKQSKPKNDETQSEALSNYFNDLFVDAEESEGDEILNMMNKNKQPKQEIIEEQEENEDEFSSPFENDEEEQDSKEPVKPAEISKQKTLSIENFLSGVKNKPILKSKSVEETAASYEFSNDSIDFQGIKTSQETKPDIQLKSMKKLQMYALDITDEFYKVNGTIYVFGRFIAKNGSSQSCCLRIQNFMKYILLHPKENFVDNLDVLNREFKEKISKDWGIKSYTSEVVKKQIVFGKCSENQTLIKISFRESHSIKINPDNLSNYSTICAVYGASDSVLEQFLVQNQIRIPQWFEILNFKCAPDNSTWCTSEFIIESSDLKKNLNILNDTECPKVIPKMVSMVLSLIQSYDKSKKSIQIVGYACAFKENFNLLGVEHVSKSYTNWNVALCPVEKSNLPYDLKTKIQKISAFKVETMPNERSLLGSLLAKIQKYDPDIIFTHDFGKANSQFLLSRIDQCKVPFFSKLGRLKQSKMPQKTSSQSLSRIFPGRLIADTLVAAKEFLNLQSYALESIGKHYDSNYTLQIYSDHALLSPNKVFEAFEDSSTLIRMIEAFINHCSLVLFVVDHLLFIPLSVKLSNICGYTLARTLLGGKVEKNEYLLLHAFYRENIVPPEKHKIKSFSENQFLNLEQNNQTSANTKAAYQGGMVLDPIVGFYPNIILLLDYNSLYPSLIIEHNICFSTVLPLLNENKMLQSEDESEWVQMLTNKIPEKYSKQAVLPQEIKKLIESRRAVKKLIVSEKCAETKANLNIEQLALKLVGNSIYGCLGFKHSRFHAQQLAKMITHKGRDSLMIAKGQAEKLRIDVIYGDTDSIMLNMKTQDISEAIGLGNKVKQAVNKQFSFLEIGIDNIYKNMLLLKKKKYAALDGAKNNETNDYDFKKEIKGIDIVRRDWSTIARNAGNEVVDIILSAKEDYKFQILNAISNYTNLLRENKYQLQDLEIQRQLNKDPMDYPSNLSSMPHVSLALRMNETSPGMFKSGTTVPFIICKSRGETHSPDMQSFHISEINADESMKPDVDYYLKNQILPVIKRIVAPFNDIKDSDLLSALGYETKKEKIDQTSKDKTVNEFNSSPNNIVNRSLYSILIHCDECDKDSILLPDKYMTPTLENFSFKCDHCKENLSQSKPKQLKIINTIIDHVRNLISKYYDGKKVCEDELCKYQTTIFDLMQFSDLCPVCKKSMLAPVLSQKDVHEQIVFIKKLIIKNETFESLANDVKIYSDNLLKTLNYSNVDTKQVFSFLTV